MGGLGGLSQGPTVYDERYSPIYFEIGTPTKLEMLNKKNDGIDYQVTRNCGAQHLSNVAARLVDPPPPNPRPKLLA